MIVKAEVTKDTVVLTLENGVKVDISVHKECIHLHFGGIEDGVVASAFHFSDTVDKLKLANYVDIGYTPRKDDAHSLRR